MNILTLNQLSRLFLPLNTRVEYPTVNNSNYVPNNAVSLLDAIASYLQIFPISTPLIPLDTNTIDLTFNTSTNELSASIVGIGSATNGQVLATDGAGAIVWTTLSGGGAGVASLALGTTGTNLNLSAATGAVTLNVPDASATNRGVITTGAQTLAGAKTFSSAPTFSTMTQHSILFAGAGGLVSQDNGNLKFNDATNLMTVGSNPLVRHLDVNGQLIHLGSAGFGVIPNNAYWLDITGPIPAPGATVAGIFSAPTTTVATSDYTAIGARVVLPASSTSANSVGFRIYQPSLGAGAAPVNMYGVRIEAQSAAAIQNSYGLKTEPTTVASATGTYGIYQGSLLSVERNVLFSKTSIGNSTNTPSALLEIESTTRGVLPPRMTTTQKNAIVSPATGLTVYDTTTGDNQYYNGTAWKAVGVTASSSYTISTSSTITTATQIALINGGSSTLPTGITGNIFLIKNTSTSTNLTLTFGANIDNSTTLVLLPLASAQLVFDGTQYWTLS